MYFLERFIRSCFYVNFGNISYYHLWYMVKDIKIEYYLTTAKSTDHIVIFYKLFWWDKA